MLLNVISYIQLTNTMKISHNNIEYRIGSNYVGQLQQYTRPDCNCSEQPVPPPIQPVYVPEKPIQPVYVPVSPPQPVIPSLPCTSPRILNPTTQQC